VKSRRKYNAVQYLKRAYESRIELLSRADVEDVAVTVSPDPDEAGGLEKIFREDLVVVDWTVWCEYLKIDAHDELKPITRTGAEPRLVYRIEYEYHATLLTGGNVMRVGGPDAGKSPPVSAEYYDSRGHDHHHFHHVDKYYPLTSKEAEQHVQDLDEAPDLQDFIRTVLGWYHAKKSQIPR